MANKQTAVGWIIDKVIQDYYLLPLDLIQQAKAMEKEQIKDAYIDGKILVSTSEQYYEETYGK